MAFLTIVTAPGLTRAQRREAARSGPPAVLARQDHRDLLRAAGFGEVRETDVTAGYRATAQAWWEESRAREAELRVVLGDLLFEDRQADRQIQLAAIDRGLLRRSLFVALPG